MIKHKTVKNNWCKSFQKPNLIFKFFWNFKIGFVFFEFFYFAQSHNVSTLFFPFYTQISSIYSAMKVNSLYLKNVSSWTVFLVHGFYLSLPQRTTVLLLHCDRIQKKNVRFLLQRHLRLFFSQQCISLFFRARVS